MCFIDDQVGAASDQDRDSVRIRCFEHVRQRDDNVRGVEQRLRIFRGADTTGDQRDPRPCHFARHHLRIRQNTEGRELTADLRS